jgi:putative endonuclease
VGWTVYMVRAGNGALYTGIATDVARRLAEHAAGAGRGAKSLRGKGPLALVLARPVGTRAEALRLEGRIKRLPKARKEALLALADPLAALAPDAGRAPRRRSRSPQTARAS